MLSASEFQRAGDMDPEAHTHGELGMLGRGCALDAPNRRLPSYTREFSYSPQPTFPVDPHHISTSYSNLAHSFYSSQSDEDPDRYLPQSAAAIEYLYDEPLMAAYHLDLANPPSNPDSYIHSYPHSDSSASSPKGTETTSSTSSHTEMFSSTQLSPVGDLTLLSKLS
ncbi:hypothetical protein B0H12DRAFT_1231854 [Mycena haematopus]|nr:hypothetical protein B0H12DRAFT_1231854 [Mycena haematopus]